jgi:hypothetical protein
VLYVVIRTIAPGKVRHASAGVEGGVHV